MDWQSIDAIDVHVHLNDEQTRRASGKRASQMASYFGSDGESTPIDEMADYYRERNMVAVIMNTSNEWRSGNADLPNDHIAEVVAAHPDVFLGFGAIDPRMGARAIREIVRCKEELGLAGIGELNPARQGFIPNESEFYPIWRAIADVGLPVLFHGGFAAAGARVRGGEGVKLRYANPILLDDIAADMPDLTIICAHPSWPWESEALATTLHKSNVFLDLSGWAPKYMSEEVRRYVNSRISDKVLFGSDWPGLTPDRWLDEFRELGLKPEVEAKVLKENAIGIFGKASGR